MIAFVSKGSGEYLKDKGIFSDIESSIKLNEATKEDTINIGDGDMRGAARETFIDFYANLRFRGGRGTFEEESVGG